ncbi:MAG: CDP-diacylglycerol--glycerol-3-phosphate 3-phosphatidyltransferase [Candidatus Brocadiia bacterium]
MLPNLLTMLRLLLVPVVLVLTYGPGTSLRIGALCVFLFAVFTDWLDGFLARRWDQITPFGTLMDPLTDKMLVLGLFFVFADLDIIPLWLALVLLFREMMVSGIRRLKAAQGDVIGANWMGKTKFVLQTILLAAGLFYLVLLSADKAPQWAEKAFLYAAVGVVGVALFFALNFFRWHARGIMTSSGE